MSTRAWVAHRISTRRAGFFHLGVRTRVVFSAFRAGVIVGIERAAGARLAFSRSAIFGGHEFLAHTALCDWTQYNTHRGVGNIFGAIF